MEIKKYAAIDIGSNAIRLLISNIIIKENLPTHYRKSSLVRVPIRLGADSFTTGIISKENIKRMVDAIQAFKLLMNVHGIEKYKACATSAMREADNSEKVIETILKETGIKIDIIDGKTEAAIISATDLNELILGDKSYLYVDVGGGSTEFTFFSKGKISLVVCRHAHHYSGTVTEQDIIAYPDGHPLSVEFIDGIGADEYPILLFNRGEALYF